MARPRKPTKILELKGSFRGRPGREKQREGEPKPAADVGRPPRHLTTEQKKVWREITSKTPEGVITAMDRCSLEIVCVLLDRFRQANAGIAERLQAAELSALMRGLSSLGMTPADRSKVSVPVKQSKTNGWDNI